MNALRLGMIALAVCATLHTANARSNAAAWLVNEQLQAACDGFGGGGQISDDAVIERDLTGDGKADLIIDHSGIDCANGRSGFCGVRACSVLFYVRKGRLLKKVEEILSIGVTVGQGRRPPIELIGHSFQRSTIRWNGRKFR